MHPVPDRFLVVVSEEMPVHVFALYVASVVADHHPVGIDDRQNPKLKLISHLVRKDVLGDQMVDEAVHNETTVGFSCMLTCDNHYDGSFWLAFIHVSNFEDWNV